MPMSRYGIEEEPDGDSEEADVSHDQGRGHNLQRWTSHQGLQNNLI